MMQLTAYLWRHVGRFMGIKGIGAAGCAAKGPHDAFNNDFWRAIWVQRCGGRIFKSPKRVYKFDVMVFFAKNVYRTMRACTTTRFYYNDWHDAVRKQRCYLQRETRHCEAAIKHMKEQLNLNKRKLSAMERVDEKATAFLASAKAYGCSATKPVRTQKRRIEGQLAASNANPWAHYF